MITILRFILFFLLAPAFAIVAHAAGAVQDDFRIVDAGLRAESVIPEGADGKICSYDSSGALLHQSKSIEGEDDLIEYGELKTSGARRPLFSFLAEFVATNRTPSQFARGLQGSGSYPGVDTFKDITLKKGTVIYGGAPGQSNFYTTASALERSGGSSSSLFQGLQVSPHPSFGYRPGVTAYEVMDDLPAAFGRTLANPQHGAGGLPQIVIENYDSVLKPIYSVPLKP